MATLHGNDLDFHAEEIAAFLVVINVAVGSGELDPLDGTVGVSGDA